MRYLKERVKDVAKLEQQLSNLGEFVGLRLYQLMSVTEKLRKKEILIVNQLYFLQTVFWKNTCGTTAESLEKSTDCQNECASQGIDDEVTDL